MKHILAIVLLILASLTIALGQSEKQEFAIDQQSGAQRAAKEELNEAARDYRAGKFAEAQRHSERALELDPSNKTAPKFIARSIHTQYRPGIDSPENTAKARDAIAAYQRLLLREPDDEEAYKAVAALYGAIGEDELQYSWILQRALNGEISVVRRAEAYVILASKDWNCSFTITERTENKRVARTKRGNNIIVYRKPKDQSDFDEALQCASRGLDMVETAITLEPENTAAWSYKTNLLVEMAKLYEMEGNRNRRGEYKRLSRDAQIQWDRLAEKQQHEVVEAEIDDRGSFSSDNAGVPSGTELEAKVMHRPLPIPTYPAIAKAAHAQGAVTVQIVVDEEGNVIDAKAISGHPLLRAAAVQAARQAVFSPTILSGQPVKVSGVITYNFSLN